MKNIFKAIGHFFKTIGEFIISDEGRKKFAEILGEAQSLIAPAMQAAATIAALTQNRTFEEVVAVAQKYALGTVTPEMIENQSTLEGLLKNAARAELQNLTGSKLDPHVLDLAIAAGLTAYKSTKAEIEAAKAKSAAEEVPVAPEDGPATPIA